MINQMGTAQTINIIEFNSINKYNKWKEENPFYIIFDIKIFPENTNIKIYIIYQKVNL